MLFPVQAVALRLFGPMVFHVFGGPLEVAKRQTSTARSAVVKLLGSGGSGGSGAQPLENICIISTVQFELPILQESIKLLEEQLDNQIDRSMRETLILHGIKGNETSWDATKEMLSSFLEELSEGELNKYDIFYSIVRAHRGGKDNKSVYVKFNNHNVMDSVKGLKLKKKGLFINQLRSPKVNKRIQEASKVKTELRKKVNSKNWKMFINEKVQLMFKKPNDSRYGIYKQF